MKKQRMMARPIDPARNSRRPLAALLGIVAVIALVGAVGVSGILAGGSNGKPGSSLVAAIPTQSSAAPAATVAPMAPSDAPSRRPARTPDGEPTLEPTGGGPKPTKTPVQTPAASRAPTDGRAPTSPADFDLEGQSIDIGFPLRPDTRYHYRDNFLDSREGAPDDYNHARVDDDGLTHRLHDGTDIYATEGDPLIAAFSGTVIEARSRWQPWESERYGKTIVIVSDEPASAGYAAIYVHCDRVWVEPGNHVSRGQVIGTVGRTGNADAQSIRAHLHFELRAPFLLDWSPLGEKRAIDAFNPYPSLVAADLKRS